MDKDQLSKDIREVNRKIVAARQSNAPMEIIVFLLGRREDLLDKLTVLTKPTCHDCGCGCG